MAQVIQKLTDMDLLRTHLLIGSDPAPFAEQDEATRTAEAKRWHAVSVSTDANTSAILTSVTF